MPRRPLTDERLQQALAADNAHIFAEDAMTVGYSLRRFVEAGLTIPYLDSLRSDYNEVGEKTPLLMRACESRLALAVRDLLDCGADIAYFGDFSGGALDYVFRGDMNWRIDPSEFKEIEKCFALLIERGAPMKVTEHTSRFMTIRMEKGELSDAIAKVLVSCEVSKVPNTPITSQGHFILAEALRAAKGDPPEPVVPAAPAAGKKRGGGLFACFM